MRLEFAYLKKGHQSFPVIDVKLKGSRQDIIIKALIHSAAFKPRPLGWGRITPLSVSILSKPRSLDRGVEGLITFCEKAKKVIIEEI